MASAGAGAVDWLAVDGHAMRHNDATVDITEAELLDPPFDFSQRLADELNALVPNPDGTLPPLVMDVDLPEPVDLFSPRTGAEKI